MAQGRISAFVKRPTLISFLVITTTQEQENWRVFQPKTCNVHTYFQIILNGYSVYQSMEVQML